MSVWDDPLDSLEKCIKIIGIAAAIATPLLYRKLPRCFTDKRQKEYRLIPSGAYKRGEWTIDQGLSDRFPEFNTQNCCDAPPTQVYLTRPFYMASAPVTVGEFRQFVEQEQYVTTAQQNNPIYYSYGLSVNGEWVQDKILNWDNPGFAQTEDHPVVCVSWDDARAYTAWLNKTPKTLKRFRGRFQYALPTEAEWEVACRGETTTTFFWGNLPEEGHGYLNAADMTQAAGLQWTNRFPFADNFVFTAKPGLFQKNPFGLNDMLGNVFEWCYDHYDAAYYSDISMPCNNPPGPSEKPGAYYPTRVIRGGGWASSPWQCRCAYRGTEDRFNSRSDLGFRVALVERKVIKEHGGR